MRWAGLKVWGFLISLARLGQSRIVLLGIFFKLTSISQTHPPHRELDYDVPPSSELWLFNRVRGRDTTASQPRSP